VIKTKYVELWNEDDIISAKVVTDEEFDNIEEGRVMKKTSNTIWLHEIITSVK